MMKYSIFQEHSHSRFVYFRFSGDLFPVVMIDGEFGCLFLMPGSVIVHVYSARLVSDALCSGKMCS